MRLREYSHVFESSLTVHLNIPGILNPYRFCFQRDGLLVSEMTQCVGRLKSEQDA